MKSGLNGKSKYECRYHVLWQCNRIFSLDAWDLSVYSSIASCQMFRYFFLKVIHAFHTPEMRRIAKAVNFGILYGLSSYGLSRDTKVSQKEAKEFIEGYFSMYPSVKVYTDRLIEETRRNGYCETILGRKRFISDINSRNGNIRMRAERMAVNAPIQGSAADIIKYI